MAQAAKKKAVATPVLVDLSPEEVQRLPKPREHFDTFADLFIGLYRTFASVLHIDGVDAETMEADLTAYQTLSATEATLQRDLDRVRETRLYHGSRLWRAMLEIYARAQAIARTDSKMRRAILVFEQWMKKPKKVPEPTTAAK